jgi:Flp pilus assembly protein TadD
MSNSAAESALEVGLKLLDQDRLVDAQKQFLAATQLAPNMAIAHYFLGFSFFNQNRFAEAEVPLRFAVQLDPRDAENLMMLGRSLMRQNKLVEAEACFKKGSELDPNERQYHEEWRLLTQYEPFRTRLTEQRNGKM